MQVACRVSFRQISAWQHKIAVICLWTRTLVFTNSCGFATMETFNHRTQNRRSHVSHSLFKCSFWFAWTFPSSLLYFWRLHAFVKVIVKKRWENVVFPTYRKVMMFQQCNASLAKCFFKNLLPQDSVCQCPALANMFRLFPLILHSFSWQISSLVCSRMLFCGNFAQEANNSSGFYVVWGNNPILTISTFLISCTRIWSFQLLTKQWEINPITNKLPGKRLWGFIVHKNPFLFPRTCSVYFPAFSQPDLWPASGSTAFSAGVFRNWDIIRSDTPHWVKGGGAFDSEEPFETLAGAPFSHKIVRYFNLQLVWGDQNGSLGVLQSCTCPHERDISSNSRPPAQFAFSSSSQLPGKNTSLLAFQCLFFCWTKTESSCFYIGLYSASLVFHSKQKWSGFSQNVQCQFGPHNVTKIPRSAPFEPKVKLMITRQ